ncbi:MAG: LysR family transcriptional regulator [Opitutaceae bacterium]|nr:LysR family transcriptional regulator [Opitutaceae bacterium]
MELRHLQYFKAVAERLNFSRAAESLRVAQPTLSRQIRDLEEELGAQLLIRNRVKVQLTDAGRVLHSHATKLLTQVEIARAAVRETAQGRHGELIISNDWRIANRFVPDAIAEFRRRHPGVELTLVDLRLGEQLNALRARRVHLGFALAGDFDPRDGLDSLRMVRSRLRVVLPASHALASARRIRLADLAAEDWVSIDERESAGYRPFVNRLCRAAGFSPRVTKVGKGIESMLARVAAGYGICVLPAFILPPQLPSLRYIDSDCAPLDLCAVWPRSDTSVLLRQFIDILRGGAKALRDVRPTPARRSD